jgi:Ca2+-binding EF-hand superfamily protein
MEEKKQKLEKAKEWMNNTLRKEQNGIQLRIAEKFYMLKHERKQSIRDIFVAFDEDGGGTIDPDELRDGFEALEIELTEYEFDRMWDVWCPEEDREDSEGEIDFDNFTEMFNKTLLVLKEQKRIDKAEKLRQAKAWMGENMKTEQKRIQLRIAEKFRMLKVDRGQSIEDIFVAFDDDGGGTIDPDEMKEGFQALNVGLNDHEFEVMWEIWDDDESGEIDFDEFAEMFNMTLLVLEANRKENDISDDDSDDDDSDDDDESKKKKKKKKRDDRDSDDDDDDDDDDESDDPIEEEAEQWAERRTAPPTCMDENDETISPREYAFFCRQTGILDNKKVKIRTIQEIFRLVNSEVENDGQGGSGQFRNRGDAEFERPEFLASIVHVALKRFPEPPPPPKPPTPAPSSHGSSELDSDWFSDDEEDDDDDEEGEVEEEEDVWMPGDSVRRLMEELVQPSMKAKFQTEDLTGRSRAFRGTGAGSCLRLSVWDHDVVGDDDFLGEMYIELNDVEDGILDYPATEEGEEAAKSFKDRLQNGTTAVLKGRPGVNTDRVMVSGDLTVSVIKVKGKDLSEWDQGRERVEVGGVHHLDFHPEMAEEDHDPKDMHGTLEFRAVIEIPRALIRRRSNKPEAKKKKEEEAVSFLTLNVHACDAVCTKSFEIRLPGGREPPPKSNRNQPGGKSVPIEYTFRWLTLIAGRRYHQLFRPHGRVRNREAGYGGTEGQLTPQGVWGQLPEGFDRLDESTNLMMKVDGETPLRKMLRDGDDVWITFQNRTPSRVIAAGGIIDPKTGNRIKPNLKMLQREQFEIDQARSWLKRTCRDDQEIIQLRIAKIFREMQRSKGQSIRE